MGLNYDMSSILADTGEDLTFEITFKKNLGTLFSIGTFGTDTAIGLTIKNNTDIAFLVWGSDYIFKHTIPDNEWTNLVAIYNSNGVRELYINGYEKTVFSTAGRTGILSLTGGSPTTKTLRIGHLPYYSVGQYLQNWDFDGYMKTLKIYKGRKIPS